MQLRSSTWFSIIAKIRMSVSPKQASRPLSMLMSHHRPSSVRLFCECVHFCTTQVLASQMLCYIQQACHKTPSGVPSWYTFLAPLCILRADPNPSQIFFYSPTFWSLCIEKLEITFALKKNEWIAFIQSDLSYFTWFFILHFPYLWSISSRNLSSSILNGSKFAIHFIIALSVSSLVIR